MNTQTGSYPEISDDLFYEKINNKKEFLDCDINSKFKDIYYLEPQQRFLSNYLSKLTDYNRILVYHSVGVGKTLSAVSIAENFRGHYRIIVITKNKNLEDNFKRQLEFFIQKMSTNLEPDQIKKIINTKYSFVSYRGISSKSRETGIDFDIGVKNTLFILDEAHNAVGNDSYDVLNNLFIKSKNIKVVLMTATPVFDNIREIFEISNLLSEKEDQVVTGRDLVREKFIRNEELVGDQGILKDSVSYITGKGKKKLLEMLKGKVSYLTPDTSSFPERKMIGEPISKTKGSINIVKCKMSSFQEKIYNNTLNDHSDNTLFKKSSDALTIVYPDSSYGIEGFTKNKKNMSFMKVSTLSKYSEKLFMLLKNIQKSKGPVFIYSNYVNKGGVEIVKNLLLQNGFSSYASRGLLDKFVIFDDSISIKTKRKILGIFNNPSNKYGKDIKIIIGSPSVSEGITFKNIRQIHLVEPYWNLSRTEQVIGRGVRFGSHSILPSKDRNVEIYLYASVGKNELESIDFLKYKLSEDKDKSIKQIEHILREIAVDCSLDKTRNQQPSSKDFTRECLYSKCDYKCSSNKVSPKIDYSTYSLKDHDISQYRFIVKKIKSLFKISQTYKLKDIISFVKKNNFNFSFEDANIVRCLEDVIDESLKMIDNNGNNCTLTRTGEYFLCNPDSRDISEPLFDKMFQSNIESKTLEKVKQSKTPVKQSAKKKISDNLIFRHTVAGYYTDTGHLKIIDNRGMIQESVKDNRKKFRGKACTSYSITELLDILKHFKSKTSHLKNKNDLCEAIEKNLRENKKIISL